MGDLPGRLAWALGKWRAGALAGATLRGHQLGVGGMAQRTARRRGWPEGCLAALVGKQHQVGCSYARAHDQGDGADLPGAAGMREGQGWRAAAPHPQRQLQGLTFQALAEPLLQAS